MKGLSKNKGMMLRQKLYLFVIILLLSGCITVNYVDGEHISKWLEVNSMSGGTEVLPTITTSPKTTSTAAETINIPQPTGKPETTNTASEYGEDADLTMFEYGLGNPRILAQMTKNWIAVQGFPPNTELMYSIYSNHGELLLGPTPIQTDDSGFARTYEDDISTLHPGYFILVSGKTVTKSITLEAIAFDVFDPSSGYCQGSAPAPFGRDVRVGVGWMDHYWSTDLITDEFGNWSVYYGEQVPSDWVWASAQIYDEDGDVSEVGLAPPSQVLGNITIAWNQLKPEEVIYLSWKGSGNLTKSNGGEYFGNGWTLQGEATTAFFNDFLDWCTTGDWSQIGLRFDINSISSDCDNPADIPVHTTYQFYDSRPDLFKVERTFEFGETPYYHSMRAFIPRLAPMDLFSEVIYPKVDGTLATINIPGDPIYQTGAIIPYRDGSWFAINSPSTGIGMIVQRLSSPYEVTLWGEDDGGTRSISSGFMLLPPARGFTGSVTETEYLCFYDRSTWTPNLTLPAGCQPE